ncbi:hypothetical protein BC829DRAFT_415615 [Chytridium lagenaria]|nr:hypothetical protein BC829DRAFT_415615 [Chytridium lagenaria]
MRAASRAVAELRDILRAAAAKLRGLSLEGDEVEVSKCSEKMRGGGSRGAEAGGGLGVWRSPDSLSVAITSCTSCCRLWRALRTFLGSGTSPSSTSSISDELSVAHLVDFGAEGVLGASGFQASTQGLNLHRHPLEGFVETLSSSSGLHITLFGFLLDFLKSLLHPHHIIGGRIRGRESEFGGGVQGGFLAGGHMLSLGLRDGGIVKLFGEEEKKEKCDGGDGEEGSVRVRSVIGGIAMSPTGVDERVGKKKDEMGRVLAVGSDGETAKTNVDDGIAVFAGAEGVGEDVRRKGLPPGFPSQRNDKRRFQFRSLLQIFLFSPALFFQELKLGDGLSRSTGVDGCGAMGAVYGSGWGVDDGFIVPDPSNDVRLRTLRRRKHKEKERTDAATTPGEKKGDRIEKKDLVELELPILNETKEFNLKKGDVIMAGTSFFMKEDDWNLLSVWIILCKQSDESDDTDNIEDFEEGY